MLGVPFYHGHIRKFIAAFGSLFDDLKIATVNGSGQIINASTVPLRYAGLDKMTLADPPDKKPYNEIFPRMSFEWNGLTPDTDRKLNPQNRINGIVAPTPYIVNMSLYILSRNMGDALQIIEQIIPFFNPTLTIQMQNTPLHGIATDVPITLTATSINDDYEGEEDKARRVEITLNFEAILDFYKNAGSNYENALTQFIIKNYNPDDPTSCTPPVNRHFHTVGNRIERITINEYTNGSEFCRLFDENPTNDAGIIPDDQIVVQATPEEIKAYDASLARRSDSV